MEQIKNNFKSNILLVSTDKYLIKCISDFKVKNIENINSFEITSNVFEARNVLNTQTIDLVLLDIHLPFINGLELLNMNKNQPFETIVFSNSNKFKNEATKFSILDYIILPSNYQFIENSLINGLKTAPHNETSITNKSICASSYFNSKTGDCVF